MKDVFGNDLEIGDEVASCVPGYSRLAVGPIVRFTAKKVCVLVNKRWGLEGKEERLVDSWQVAKKA